MLSRKRKVLGFLLAIGTGAAVLLAIHACLNYFSLWYANLSLPPGYWRSYVLRVLIISTPTYLVACSVVVLMYRWISGPTPGSECRCRRCGYILRGISKPECSECGEVI